MTESISTSPISPARGGASRAVAAIIVCQLMLMVDGVIVTVALPNIRASLGLDTSTLSWVVSAYALAFAGFLLVSGRIGTRIGPRRALVIGVSVFVVASAAGGLAPTGELLILARAIQGVGAALAGPSILVLITANTGEAGPRLRAMSWYIIASSAGSAVGLIAGGILTVTLGWRWVMLVNVPIGILVIVGTVAFTRESPSIAGRIDIAGATLSALAMTGLVFGLTRSSETGWSDPSVLAALGTAALASIVLVVVERRVAQPVLPLRLLRGRRSVPYLAMLLMPAGLIGFFTFSVLRLQDVRGLDALQAGLAFLPWAVGVIVGGRLVPHLLPRLGERATITAGVIAALAGIAAFALLGDAPLWLGVLLPCLVLGFGPALVFTPMTNRIMTDASTDDTGPAAALLQSLQQLGGAIGVASLTTVYTGQAALGIDAASTVTLLASTVFPVVILVLVMTVPSLAAPGTAMHTRPQRQTVPASD